jgi:hypothetical protein
MSTRRAFLGLLATSTLGGCGYALVGRGTVVDPDIKKIGVPPFGNSSGKADLDVKISQSVLEELLKRGRFDVVPDATGVNALVKGEIVAYRAAPVGFGDGSTETGKSGGTATTQASRYEISVTAKVRYTKVGVEEPIWANDSFNFKEEYDLGSDPSVFIDRETQALDRLADAFARSLVASMLEAF